MKKASSPQVRAADRRIEDGLVVIGVAVGFMVAALEFLGIGI